MNYAFTIGEHKITFSQHEEYKKLIDRILDELYPRIYLNGFFYVKKQKFDNKKAQLSILNKSIGNITILVWLFRDFKFDSFNELIKFVDNNKSSLFKEDGIHFSNVLNILKISERKGIKNEKKAIRYIKSYLRGRNFEFKIKQTPLYSKMDIIDGIDIIITINDKDYYVQVKPLKFSIIEKGYYKIISSGKIKKYENIHYYIFVNNNECLFFSNKNLVVKDGNIYIPTTDLK